MRFSIPPSYADFFSTRHIIELEEILLDAQADLLCTKGEAHLLESLHQKPLHLASNLELWKAGKDLWKHDPEVKKILFQLKLGEIANNLFKTRPIRLVLMQTLFTENKEDSVFAKDLTLNEICSATPLLGGVFLCLDSSEVHEKEPLPNLLHQQKGRAVFFSADYPIPFKELFKQKKARYLLLALAPHNARYKLEANDIHTHALKKEGYVFGDSLREETAPYLFH